MRDLSYGAYTHDQVVAQLTATSAATGSRFELLDLGFHKIKDITTVVNERGAAVVDVNADRQYKSALHLRMLADEDLRALPPFTGLIRPWFRLKMPNGDIVEYPMGLYAWPAPSRTFDLSTDVWDIVCSDQLQILDLGDPGDYGFRVNQGTLVVNAAASVLVQAFGAGVDLSGVQQSVGQIVSQTLVWALTTPADYTVWQEELKFVTAMAIAGELTPAYGVWAPQIDIIRTYLGNYHTDTAPVTWLKIMYALCDAGAYYGAWYDWTGRARIMPAYDLTTADMVHHFAPGPNSILLLPAMTAPQVQTMANYVTVRPSTNDPALGPARADANTLFPAHPFTQSRIGRYVRKTVSDTVAGTQAQLQARANKELGDALAVYQTLKVASLAMPQVEPFDLTGVLIQGDPEYGTERPGQLRGLAFDLYDGAMTHEIRRIYR